MRRPPHVVLWGGRPGRDIQFGGGVDREREKMRAAYARLQRSIRTQLRVSDEVLAAILETTRKLDALRLKLR